MNNFSRKRKRRHAAALHGRRRAGLAPLELVLALPILLFVMALIVNIGAVGAWKVREQTNARHASWRTMHLRTGDAHPNPPLWPADAAALRGGTAPGLQDPRTVWDGVPELTAAPVRGPVVMDPFTGQSIRARQLLELSEGVHDGHAPLERRIPLLRGILPNGGRYAINIPHNVLDRNWEFHDLGYVDNADRRVRLLYEIEPDDFPTTAALENGLHLGAWADLRGFPLAGDLIPLDRDPDFMRYRVVPPDFYPGLPNVCLAEPGAIQGHPRYRLFLDSIRRLPGRMGRSFRSLYQNRLNYLQSLMPPPPGAQQEIQWLQDRINELTRFLGSLPQAHQ